MECGLIKTSRKAFIVELTKRRGDIHSLPREYCRDKNTINYKITKVAVQQHRHTDPYLIIAVIHHIKYRLQ